MFYLQKKNDCGSDILTLSTELGFGGNKMIKLISVEKMFCIGGRNNPMLIF